MEVGAVGQGGQASINVNINADGLAKVDNTQPSDNIKITDNSNNNNISKEDNIKEKDIKKAIDKLNMFLEDNKTHVEYEVHDKFKDIMIKIVDDKSGEVIQELPPKKILDMVAKMCEMVGVLFDKRA